MAIDTAASEGRQPAPLTAVPHDQKVALLHQSYLLTRSKPSCECLQPDYSSRLISVELKRGGRADSKLEALLTESPLNVKLSCI